MESEWTMLKVSSVPRNMYIVETTKEPTDKGGRQAEERVPFSLLWPGGLLKQ